MAFSKTFPKTIPGTNYPVWEEIFLTIAEEQEVEDLCKKANFLIMDDAIQEAKALMVKNGMNEDSNIVSIAKSLFDKRASHLIFWKESRAKEKFDQKSKE
jgi:hypothetical protein